MWVVFTIVFILLGLLVGFLITPVVLYFDSDKKRFEIRQRPVFKFFLDQTTLKPRLTIAGLSVPLGKRKGDTENRPSKNKPAKRKKSAMNKSFRVWRFLIQHALGTFRVRRFILLLDTGDVVLNAKLTPLCVLASRGPFCVQTNFDGRVYFHLEVLNRPVSVLWIFLQFLTKK